MVLHRILVAVALLAAGASALASSFAIGITDYALPGRASTVERLGESAMCGDYRPLDGCMPTPFFTPDAPTVSNDKQVKLRMGGLWTSADATNYDYYMTFKEAGANPAVADDALRIQFNVLGPQGTIGGLDVREAELIIDFISGSLVTDELLDQWAMDSTFGGSFVNAVNEVIPLGAYPFATQGQFLRFGEINGPNNEFDGLPLMGLLIAPTVLVGEPAGLALGGLGVALLFATRRVKRRPLKAWQ